MASLCNRSYVVTGCCRREEKDYGAVRETVYKVLLSERQSINMQKFTRVFYACKSFGGNC